MYVSVWREIRKNPTEVAKTVKEELKEYPMTKMIDKREEKMSVKLASLTNLNLM